MLCLVPCLVTSMRTVKHLSHFKAAVCLVSCGAVLLSFVHSESVVSVVLVPHICWLPLSHWPGRPSCVLAYVHQEKRNLSPRKKEIWSTSYIPPHNHRHDIFSAIYQLFVPSLFPYSVSVLDSSFCSVLVLEYSSSSLHLSSENLIELCEILFCAK
jgi:hypothetical protein